MYKLNETVSVKQWQMNVMLLMSGFAIGSILANLTDWLGF